MRFLLPPWVNTTQRWQPKLNRSLECRLEIIEQATKESAFEISVISRCAIGHKYKHTHFELSVHRWAFHATGPFGVQEGMLGGGGGGDGGKGVRHECHECTVSLSVKGVRRVLRGPTVVPQKPQDVLAFWAVRHLGKVRTPVRQLRNDMTWNHNVAEMGFKAPSPPLPPAAQATIMGKSIWDDADSIWNYELLFYLKAIINIVGSYDAPLPSPESILVWVGGPYVLCAADIPTLIRGEGKLVSSQHFWPWL